QAQCLACGLVLDPAARRARGRACDRRSLAELVCGPSCHWHGATRDFLSSRQRHGRDRLFPVEGFVKCVPKNLHLPQLKSALIYFAGPGVELLVAAAVALLVGPDQLFTSSDDYLLIVWQSLALASTVQAVLNLLPHAIPTPEGLIANDGLGIIRSFFMPQAYYAEMIGQTYGEKDHDWESYDPADWWNRR